MNATQKIVQYLGEAKASEDALVRVLQSQIAMTPAGEYRSALETHLEETRRHSRRVRRRIDEIGGARNPLALVVGLAEEAVGQALALSKTPLDLMRGTGGEEKILKNAKDAAATEALEIATYTALERLATSAGDDETAALAKSIRGDEERMLDRILRQIPALTDAVARAELHGDPSYDISRTGAADAMRAAADQVGQAAERATEATRSTARKVPGAARAEGEIKGAVADGDDLAISGYDDLTAEEITARLPKLSQLELAKIDAYERRHHDRTTVLERIESLQGDEPWPGYDELKATEIESVLSEGDEDRNERVRDYERHHKNRAGVLRAAERKLAKH